MGYAASPPPAGAPAANTEIKKFLDNVKFKSFSQLIQAI